MTDVAHFQLLDELGAGGMGVVYKARDTRLDRTVALKFLSPEESSRPEGHERLLRGARAAAALSHPNVATIYEIGSSKRGDFIAMEFIDGDLLHERLRGEPIPLDLAIDWAAQLCDGIGAAHALGVVHRDIKASNIMITRDNRIKVLDFGIAFRSSTDQLRDSESRPTAVGKIVGTIHYMAPEIIRGEEATPASDVFSIGVVLYELITGRAPFEATQPAQAMYEILHIDPPPLSAHREEIAPALDTIVRRAMAKNKTDRYADAGEVLADVKRLTLEQTISPSRSAAKPLDAVSNLPVSMTSFIGRSKELTDLEALLEQNRLLTITGPGGAGKTRVSLELGARSSSRFPEGVFLIPLAPMTKSAEVIRTLARVLCVRDEPGRELAESVVDHVGKRRILLLFDNCEHLIDAAADAVRMLLESCPGTKIVTTSQERLGVPGEAIWQISSLSLPSSDDITVEAMLEHESVQLFVDRARQVKANFQLDEHTGPSVVQICQRLDGIPLAIELAAVRVRFLPPDKILKRLEDRFQLLTGGSRTSLPRQQTLRAAVEWSLDLLAAPELRLFRALSVFTGGMTLEAVEHVCAGGDADTLEILGRLIDKSLVLVRDGIDDEPRYDMLETLREYGAARLRESGEEPGTRTRHADFVLAQCETAGPELTGPDQVRWLNRIDAESENIASAIHWLIGNSEGEKAVRIAGAIWRLWFVRGHLGTGRELIGAALEAYSETDEITARALYGAGVLASDQADREAARTYFERCLTIRRELGDRRGIAQTLNSLGIAARDQGDYKRARKLLEEGRSINREIGDRSGTAMSIHALGIAAHREGDCRKARKLFEEGFEIRKALGDRRGIAALLAHLGSVDFDLGRFDRAEPMLDRALADFRELDNKRGIVYALMYLGGVALERGNFKTAREHHTQCLTISRTLGDKEHIVHSLEWLARLAAAEREHAWAIELEGAASASRETFHIPRTPMEEKALDAALKSCWSAMDRSAAKRARAKGRARSLNAAIEAALQDAGAE